LARKLSVSLCVFSCAASMAFAVSRHNDDSSLGNIAAILAVSLP
jgi:hypothetical protein